MVVIPSISQQRFVAQWGVVRLRQLLCQIVYVLGQLDSPQQDRLLLRVKVGCFLCLFLHGWHFNELAYISGSSYWQWFFQTA